MFREYASFRQYPVKNGQIPTHNLNHYRSTMKKILIAEDDESYRMLAETYLEDYADKYELIGVEDGLAAMDVLKKEEVSVLITDLKMPRVDGLLLLVWVNLNYPFIPCIVMTSYKRPKLKKKLIEDVLHYLEKPFQEEELIRAVENAIKAREIQGELAGISIASFLQLIELEKETCLCRVETETGEKGFFFFRTGELQHAEFENLRGEEAAIKMIRLGSANVHIEKNPDFSIDIPMYSWVSELIEEAALWKT